jgi:hypothetical protein
MYRGEGPANARINCDDFASRVVTVLCSVHRSSADRHNTGIGTDPAPPTVGCAGQLADGGAPALESSCHGTDVVGTIGIADRKPDSSGALDVTWPGEAVPRRDHGVSER